MNARRAQQISRAFSHVSEINVEELSGGLLVHHHGKACYCVREACFRPFVFKQLKAELTRVNSG